MRKQLSIVALTNQSTLEKLNLNGDEIKLTAIERFGSKVKHTAFFCRMEDQMSKSARLPVKIRLGEVNYTEKLEGKNVFDRFSLPK